MATSGSSLVSAALSLSLLYLSLLPLKAQEPPVERLVNLDTPTGISPGKVFLLGDLRIFGAQEDLTYGTFQLGYGLYDELALILRTSLAGKKDYLGPGFTIRHGGTDVELQGQWRPSKYPNWALALGLSMPDSPAQNSVNLTTQLLYQRLLGSRVTISFVPKAVFVKDNPIIGIGGGMSVRINNRLSVVGDITGIVSGNNTRSIFTGDKIRGEVWGLALRFAQHAASSDISVDLGVTNGTGGTTGFSLTPGLSGSAAFYLSLTWRR